MQLRGWGYQNDIGGVWRGERHGQNIIYEKLFPIKKNEDNVR